jgi:Tfp pilus assembly protein PilF
VPTSSSNPNEIIDLSDLPAPKRQSPLGGAPESRAAPRSGLAAALDAELPAPKAARPAGPPSLDLDDLLGPPGAGPTTDLVDLPAPKAKASADLPAPKVPRAGMTPAAATPVVPGGDADLPAPKPRSPIQRQSATQAPQPLSLDLDLPAPRSSGPAEISDLLAPKGISDLPTPKPGRTGSALPDLLQPKPGQVAGRGNIDLPAPKGGGIDLPAPKGFFDDLPQPARGQRSAGSGGPVQTDDIAPKGFFDDLPQPARGQRSGPSQTDDIAPKGFFDDLPQPAKGQRPGPMPTDDIAPKGFFDDLPQPATISPPAPIDQPRLKRDSRGAIDLGEDPIEQIDLANESPQELELEEPPVSQQASGSFDDLDLSAPSAAQGVRAQQLEESSAIKIGTPKTPGGKSPERASLPSLSRSGPGADEPLELEEPRETQSISQRLGPKPQRPTVEPKPPKKPVNRKLVLGLVLGLAAAGGGGFYFYQRHAAAQERQNTIDEELSRARKALSSDSPNRWSAAQMAASKVLDMEPTHGPASGIFAEGAFAGALADGKNIDARFQAGRKKVNDALGAGITGPELDRASALQTIPTNAANAVKKLQELQKKAPKDPSLALYLGWAQTAAGAPADAIQSFDIAANAPATKLHALVGRGRVKLDQGDLEGARTDFTAALTVDKKNIPAQVGLAASLPLGQAQQQEADLVGIIAAKEFKDADPRAKALAYLLAGDAARRSGRLDVARERYRKALEIDKKAIAALASLAEVEIADGKRDVAKTLIDQALVQVKDYPAALLAKAQLAFAEKRVDDADAIIKGLEESKKPLPTLLQVRVGIMRGRILDAKKQDDAALDAYAAAAKLAGELDLTPTMVAIAKLTEMAKVAAAAKDTEREAALKTRAEELLATLAAAAEKDPSLAFTLGVAYQNAGEPALAEPWLQKVIAARPNDPDAMYQLAVTLRALDRRSEELAMLEKAQVAAPDRIDLATELARTYEASGKDAEADALYTKLLAPPTDGATVDLPIELRMHAGLFYVRNKKFKDAGEQGRAIVKAARDNATGHYLVGESALAAGNIEEARKEFVEAVSYERTARHLDAAGRANESISIAKKDMAMQDAAIRAYQDAVKLDPTMFSAQLGLGRLFVTRKEMEKAVPPLLEANKIKANDPEVSYNLGAAFIRLSRTDADKKKALAWLLQAVRYDQTPETYNLIGDIYSMDGVDDGRAAANAYGKAVHAANQEAKKSNAPLPPWYPEALFQWGRRSLEIGDEGTAKKAWEQWLGMSPPPPMNARRKEVERMLATTLRGP